MPAFSDRYGVDNFCLRRSKQEILARAELLIFLIVAQIIDAGSASGSYEAFLSSGGRTLPSAASNAFLYSAIFAWHPANILNSELYVAQ